MPRINGQLYWVDPASAHTDREQNPVYQRFEIRPSVLKKLDEMIRNHHWLAKLFYTAHELYDNAKQEAIKNGELDVQHFRITLLSENNAPSDVKDKKLHPRQVNLPQVSEVAAIHCSNIEEPPLNGGAWLSAKKGQIIKLFNDSKFCDAAIYPLIYPYGADGYYKGIKKIKAGKQDEEIDLSWDSIKNKGCISKRQYYSIIIFTFFHSFY
jgi:hypothetical protein